MKQCISNEQIVKAIEAGARLMLVKIDLDNAMAKHISSSETLHEDNLKSFIPIQQGDEIYIAEEVFISLSSGLGMYKRDIPIEHRAKFTGLWELCSEQQSCFKFKVGDVSVKRVQDILNYSFYENLMGNNSNRLDWENWLKDQGIDYGANQYVALVELKEIAS